MPKLTIAIPTYNRLDKLKRCIKNVQDLCEGKDIDILVSDNCSTDGTEKYMRSVIEGDSKITYYRNNENLGSDKNFLNCFVKAKGEYILLLGDDDILLKNGLNSILSAIDKNPVFIHLNTSSLSYDRYGNEVISSPRLQECGLQVYTDKNEFLEKIGIYITFMSSLVMRTEYIREIENIEQYVGTYFIQSHIALQTMKHNGIYILDTINCCAETSNTAVSYDLYYVWAKCFGDLITNTGRDCCFDDKILDRFLYKAFDEGVFNIVCHFRRTCKNEYSWNKDYLWGYIERYPSLVAKYRAVVNCPRTWLIIKLFVYRALKKVKTYLLNICRWRKT